MPIVEFKDVSRVYVSGDHEQKALDKVSFSLDEGKFVVILGPSGAGKSTLLNLLGGLDSPTDGKIYVSGKDISTLSNDELADYRASTVGFVFQFYNLVPTLTVKENVMLVNEIAPNAFPSEKMLEEVGLSDHLNNFPSELSGGEQQRVSIARALAKNPKILLCDEATSALDPQTTQSILSLIRDIHDRLGITVIIITHQMSVVEQICTRVAILDGGTVAEEGAVSGVFSSPKSEAAKRLVYPEGYQNPVMSGEDGAVIRVVFNGANATETPLIAKMAIEENIAASILSASTRSIGDKAYGNMLLGISGGGEQTQRALDYLGSIPDIFVEEVKQ